MKDKTILSIEKQALERWRNGDPLGFVEISDEEIIYFDPSLVKPIFGVKEFEAYMKLMAGRVNYQKSEFIEPRVVVVGEAAVLSYNYRTAVLAPDGTIAEQTPWNVTEVYFQRKDAWKVIHSHWSFTHHKLPSSMVIPLPVQMSPLDANGVSANIMALESTAMERWRKGDPGGFTELYAPEVTYFDTGTPLRINGREALQAEMKKREGKIFFDAMDFIAPRVQACGDLAVLSYRFLSTWLRADGSVSHRTPWNCTEVFIRIKGKWKIIHNHWSYIRGERI
jgi:ketosteroid isomerase-like protein